MDASYEGPNKSRDYLWSQIAIENITTHITNDCPHFSIQGGIEKVQGADPEMHLLEAFIWSYLMETNVEAPITNNFGKKKSPIFPSASRGRW